MNEKNLFLYKICKWRKEINAITKSSTMIFMRQEEKEVMNTYLCSYSLEYIEIYFKVYLKIISWEISEIFNEEHYAIVVLKRMEEV